MPLWTVTDVLHTLFDVLHQACVLPVTQKFAHIRSTALADEGSLLDA